MALACLCAMPGTAFGQSNTWLAAPASNDYNSAANWTNGIVPTNGLDGSFDATTTPSVTITGFVNPGTFRFNAGAPAYTIVVDGGLTLSGGGISNSSADAPTLVSNFPGISFTGSSSAGNARFTLSKAPLYFLDASSAANANISASAGSAVNVQDFATLGTATVSLQGSFLTFVGGGSGGGASVTSDAQSIVSFVAATGAGNSTLGSLAGSGQVQLGNRTLTIGLNNASTTYDGIISGSGGILKTGAGTLTLGGANTYSGGTTINQGTLQGTTLSLQGIIDSNVLVVFNQATAGTFGGTLVGHGALTVTGGGQVTMNGANAASAGTAVNGASLIVNGILSSRVTVNSSGLIGGNGAIDSLTSNGGTVSPGTSIGTLSVAGGFTQNGGSYSVEINSAGQSDRVNVGLAATIGSGTSVAVTAQPGRYARNTTYTILSSTTGVTGTYTGATGNFAFVSPTLTYDANNVYLVLTQSESAFASGARTPNQAAVGNALDRANGSASGDFNTVLEALSGLTVAQGPAALNAISGQNYAAFSNAMVQGAQLFMGFFANQAGGGGPAGSTVALAEACDLPCDASGAPLWRAWGGALGGTGTISGSSNSGALTYNAGGFAAGLDRRLTDTLVAGVTVGYVAGQQWVDGFSGQSFSNTVTAGLYASYAQGPVYVDALGGYAYSANQMSRNIALPGLPLRTAYGQSGANQVYGQLEGGFRFDLGGRSNAFATAFARLQGFTGTQNAFTETGAQSLNLSVAAQTTTSLRSVLGIQLGASMDAGWRDRLNARLRLGWSHEFADTARPVAAAFAGAPTIPFTTYGATPQRDGVLLGLSLDTAIAAGTQAFVRYEGTLSGQDNSHAAMAGVRVRW